MGERVRHPAPSPAPNLVKFCCVGFVSMGDLSLARQFSLESQSRAIDSCDDVAELRRIAKTLLSAWHLQADMTRHYGAQALGIAPMVA